MHICALFLPPLRLLLDACSSHSLDINCIVYPLAAAPAQAPGGNPGGDPDDDPDDDPGPGGNHDGTPPPSNPPTPPPFQARLPSPLSRAPSVAAPAARLARPPRVPRPFQIAPPFPTSDVVARTAFLTRTVVSTPITVRSLPPSRSSCRRGGNAIYP